MPILLAFLSQTLATSWGRGIQKPALCILVPRFPRLSCDCSAYMVEPECQVT